MAVTFGPYFVVVAVSAEVDALPNLGLLAFFGVAAFAQVVILALGHWYLRRRAPLDARTPPDERDQAIDRRSVVRAYYLLVAGLIVVGVVMPFNASGWQIVNAALLAVVTAEVVHYASTVTSYRSQS